MSLFDKCLKIVLIHEGGYSDDPDDPGGTTNYGISLRFLKSVGLELGDVDDDGDIDADDIRKMDIASASKLYKKFFWDKMNLNLLSTDLLILHLFDMGVNAGNSTAIKILQRILNVTVDGVLWKETLGALLKADQNEVISKYIQARYAYYDAIVVKNPKLKKYIKGWYNRVSSTKF